MVQKSTYLKAKKLQKKLSGETKTKATKSKLSLKGNEKSGYVLSIIDGSFSDDIQITHSELHELYYILERKFGEFKGYKIK